MSRLLTRVFILVVPLLRLPYVASIPGTKTASGYDTELGIDPICWQSTLQRRITNATTQNVFQEAAKQWLDEDDVLARNDFQLLNDRIDWLSECPANVTIQVALPDWGWRPRSETPYNFSVAGRIDLNTLNVNALLPLDQNVDVQVQVILCRLGSVGFCSPFVHEQANEREATLGIDTSENEQILGTMHGGTHVHSQTVNVSLAESASPGIYEFYVDVPFLVNEPGDFFVVGSMRFLVTNETTTTLTSVDRIIRYDVANAAALDDRVVKIQEPPAVPPVTKGTEYFIYALTAVGSTIILFYLEETLRHRHNQILRLSQGPFLVLLLVAALWATACCWLMNPSVLDLYCQLYSPMIMIPIQLIYAIIIGRIWRSQQVLSPLLQEVYETKFSRLFSYLLNLLACHTAGNRKAIRATVTSRQLATVVFIFTLPQVILQVLGLILQPRSIQIIFNDDASVGRLTCAAQGALPWLSLQEIGFYLIVWMNLLVCLVAQVTQRLPSLFDELSMIRGMSMTNVLVLVFGLAILVVTAGPTTSPDVSYLVWVVVILSITLNSSIRLLHPKLRMVWRGETVLVSKLVADHRANNANSKKNKSSSTTTHNTLSSRTGFLLKNVQGFSFRHRQQSKSSSNPSSTNSFSNPSSSIHRSSVEQSTPTFPGTTGRCESLNILDEEDEEMSKSGKYDSSNQIFEDSAVVLQHEDEEQAARKALTQQLQLRPGMPDEGIVAPIVPKTSFSVIDEQEQHQDVNAGSILQEERLLFPLTAQTTKSGLGKAISKASRRRIRVTDDETPSRTLVVPMVKLQEKLIQLNQRITTGICVSHEDWEEVRTMTIALGNKFASNVKFEWEEDAGDAAKRSDHNDDEQHHLEIP